MGKKAAGIALIVVGAIFIVLGIGLGVGLPDVVNNTITSGVQGPDSSSMSDVNDPESSYSKWLRNWDPIDDKKPHKLNHVYIYNLTNPQGYLFDAERPMMNAVGPYTFWLKSTKYDVSFSGTDDEYVSYRTYTEYEYQASNDVDVNNDMFYSWSLVYLGGLTSALTGSLYPTLLGIYGSNPTVFGPHLTACAGQTAATINAATQASVECRLSFQTNPVLKSVFDEVYGTTGADTGLLTAVSGSVLGGLVQTMLTASTSNPAMTNVQALVQAGIAGNVIAGATILALLSASPTQKTALNDFITTDPTRTGVIATSYGGPTCAIPNILTTAIEPDTPSGYGNYAYSALCAKAAIKYAKATVSTDDDSQDFLDLINALFAGSALGATSNVFPTNANHQIALGILLDNSNTYPALSWGSDAPSATFATNWLLAAGAVASGSPTAIGAIYGSANFAPLAALMDVTTFAAVVGGYFGLAALPKADLAAIYSPLFLPYTTEAAAAAGSAFSTFKDFTSQQLLFAQLGGAALTQGDSLLESSLFLATVQQLQAGGAVIPIPQTYIDNDDGKYWIEPFLYNLNVWAPANYLGYAAQYNLQAGGNYKSGVYLTLAQTGALINILTTYTSSAFGLIGAASYPLSKAGEQIGNLVTAGLTADAVGYTNSVTPACGMGPPTTAAAVQSAIITILVAGDFGSTACRDAIIGTGSGTALIGFMAAIKTALTNANNQWTAWGLNLSSLGPTTTAPDAMASSTFRIAFHALMLVDYFQKNFFLITGEFLTGDQRNDGLIIHRSALEIMSGAHYAIAPGGTAAGFLWNSFRTPYSPTADLNKYSRGIADINTVNTYVEYEGATQLAANYFPRMTAEKPELRNIRGFDYTQFVPAEKTVIMVDVDKPRYNHYDVFLEPASRTFRLFYQNKDDDILGVKCNRFAVSTDELTLETGNFGNNKYYGSSFDGAQYGGNTNPFHSFVSRPYYLYGNDIYDLYPDFETEASPSKHETTICIEPLTGATVDGSLNFMGSLGLDKTGFTASSRFAFGYDLNSTYLIDQSQMYDDTNPVLQPPLPLYWYTQTATLNEATADALKSSLYGATKGAYAALIVGIVLGSILVIVGIVLLVLHKKEGGLGKTESTAEMLKSPAFAPEVNNPTYER